MQNRGRSTRQQQLDWARVPAADVCCELRSTTSHLLLKRRRIRETGNHEALVEFPDSEW
jgi:hypothetical protein